MNSVFATARSRTSLQYAIIVLLAAVIALQISHTWHARDPQGRYATVSRDFSDFYCAGATRNAGQNPYLLQPFDTCGSKGPRYRPVYVDAHRPPAPIPGYDVALFRLFALLPFATAASVWLGISLAALLCTVVLIARLSRLPPLIVFAALAVPSFRFALEWGQMMPIVMGALAVAAYCVSTRRYALAAIAASASLIEPHLGLPVCLAMFVLLPRTRLAVVASCSVLALISIATLGLATNLEYVRVVVPLQIAAEAPANNQMSLTWVLFWLGVGQGLAIKLGMLSYYVTLAAGVWLARRCVRAFDAPELSVLVPPVIAVIGGPFMHVVQTTVAILPALYFAGRFPQYRRLAWAAIFSFSIEWYSLNYFKAPWSAVRIESIVVLLVLALYDLRMRPMRERVALSAGALVAYLAVSTALLHVPELGMRPADPPAAYAASLGSKARYSVAEWGVTVRESPATKVSSTLTFFLKLPCWFGLAFITATVARAARRKNGQPLAARA